MAEVSTTTAFPGGTYTLTGFGAGAYTVTPSKTGGQNNITSFDAARISQHVTGSNPLSGNQLIVADVSGNGSVSSFDASQIARYVITILPYGSTGSWKFLPVNRTYSSVSGNITGEDYSAFLMGEVSGNWTDTGARPIDSGISSRQSAVGSGPVKNIAVNLPKLTAPSNSEIIVPVTVESVAGKGVISYEFDLRYDPTVIKPLTAPVDVAGTASRGLSVVTNVEEPGLLRVVFYGPMPIASNGLLMNLRFIAVGGPGAVSPLVWEHFMFNEGMPQVTAANGQVEISAAAAN